MGMRVLRQLALILFITVMTSAAIVKAADCPTIVRDALDATHDACATTGRNQACYGNINLTVEAAENAPAFTFTQPGDLVEIAGVKNFVLSPLDPSSDTWGVALMKLQANIPDTLPGQNVTVVLFGDVEITNAASDDQNAMQAFYLKTGLNDAPCEKAPDSGILIQTPEGGRKIELTVDEVAITLGSSAYLQAQPDGEFTMSVVEGEGTVSAAGVTVTLPAGTRARVPLDANLAAAGAPVGPEPYDEADLAALPLGLLPEAITLAPGLEATPEATAEAGASGDAIQPQPGSWRYVVTEASGTGECAPFVNASIFPPVNLTLEAGAFDLVTFMSSGGGGAPDDIVIEQPTPNQYIASMSVDGQPAVYTFDIVSDTEIQASLTTAAEGCDLTMSISITHQG